MVSVVGVKYPVLHRSVTESWVNFTMSTYCIPLPNESANQQLYEGRVILNCNVVVVGLVTSTAYPVGKLTSDVFEATMPKSIEY